MYYTLSIHDPSKADMAQGRIIVKIDQQIGL